MADPQGVYVTGPDGRPVLVHEYLNENYGLGDVHGSLRLGRITETPDTLTVTLSRKEITDLLNLANAFSFDYDEGFIEMCGDMHRAAVELPGESVTFIEKL